MEESSTHLCAICSVPSAKYCSNCHKVHYCSTEHQKSHRKIHRPSCFPAELLTDDVQGRHFVASKPLAAGDLIFVDEAVVHGPSGAETQLHRICVGCCRIIADRNLHECPRCAWPVCEPDCSSRVCHAAFECPIFADLGIQFRDVIKSPVDYDMIKYLRTALLKVLHPPAWNQLATLASHKAERATNPADVRVTREAQTFICHTCNLSGCIDLDEVNHVVGIWTVNSFGANPPSFGSDSKKRMAASFLFPKTSLASHGCIANTTGILIEQEQAPGPQGTGFAMKLYAATPIAHGEPIYITYVNVAEGTAERQRVLQSTYYFTCTCKRCQDPTECGTNYSAVRCIGECNCAGFLLPVNPTRVNSVWKCDAKNCGHEVSYETDIRPQIQTVRKEMAAIMISGSREAVTVGVSVDKLVTIKQMEDLLGNQAAAMFHPNHWLVVEMEYNLMQLLTSYIQSLPTGTGRRTGEKDDEAKWTARLVEVCKHCLSIADVLQPGLNSYRGMILYCFVEAKLNEMALQISNGNRSEKPARITNRNSNGGRRNGRHAHCRNEVDVEDLDLTVAIQEQELRDIILPYAQEAYAIFSMEPSLHESSANSNGNGGQLTMTRKLANRMCQIRAMLDSFDKMCK